MNRRWRHLKRDYLGEYTAWHGMLKRCYDPQCNSFPNYGGRGIRVCPRWRKSFDVFVDDMGRKPSAAHSLERRKGNENYSPENCKWATNLEQKANMRSNTLLTFRGKCQHVNAWAREL